MNSCSGRISDFEIRRGLTLVLTPFMCEPIPSVADVSFATACAEGLADVVQVWFGCVCDAVYRPSNQSKPRLRTKAGRSDYGANKPYT